MEIYFKGELLGYVEADRLQDAFPWSTGYVVPTAAMEKYLEFFVWYEEAEIEFDYAPFREEAYEYAQGDDAQYPRDDEERYRRSELYEYTEALKRLHRSFRERDAAAVERMIGGGGWGLEQWTERWSAPEEAGGCDERRFAAYLEFLNYRNWLVSDGEQEVPWLPYPPNFNTRDMSIAWR